MKIRIIKRAAKKPLKLENGDVYDGVLINIDGVTWDGVVNTTPSVFHDYDGEIEDGRYIAKKKIRANGMIVWELETIDGKKEIPATKANKRHGGKKIMKAVQIHVGGRLWDGSRGCITIHPDVWQKIRAKWPETLEVDIVSKKVMGDNDGVCND